MIEKRNDQLDINSIGTSAAVFVQYYNENIPVAFPRATLKTLEKFRVSHPSLFKESGDWIIDRHRKKLMDWLASYGRE